tara:strand:- start:25 stop:732 length:708 start_codon:yes stop_codon:yes gene_type:complete
MGKLKYLFSNGCSFGGNRGSVNTNTGKEIADKLSLNHINYSAGGRGNDRIISTTKTWFLQDESRMKNSLAVIGLSSPGRLDFICNVGVGREVEDLGFSAGWLTTGFDDVVNNSARLNVFKKKQYVKERMSIEENITLRSINQTLTLQDFFKLNNIPYVIFYALPNIFPTSNKEIAILSSQVDSSNLYVPYGKSQYSWCVENKYCIDIEKDQHPNLDGQILWAEQLFNFMEQNKII